MQQKLNLQTLHLTLTTPLAVTLTLRQDMTTELLNFFTFRIATFKNCLFFVDNIRIKSFISLKAFFDLCSDPPLSAVNV